jgi:hypothetical protein
VSDEKVRPRTLAGSWLHAVRDPERREYYRIRVHRGRGWTTNELVVLEAAFEQAIGKQIATRGRWPDGTRFANTLRDLFPKFQWDRDKVQEMLVAAVDGRVSSVADLSGAQRMVICSAGFAVSVSQMGLPDPAVIELVLAAEDRAFALGYTPALVSDDDPAA